MSAADLHCLTSIRLGKADTADALLRSDASGWNQVAEDWQLFIEFGNTFGFRDQAGRLIATAAALPYVGGVGWISMVLVAEEHRHRGLASRLMEDCIKTLTDANITPVLDATPAGEPVYVRLGFRGGFALDRWERDAVGNVQAEVACEAAGDASRNPHASAARVAPRDPAFAEISNPVDAQTLEDISNLDATSTGIGRRFLIESFLSRGDSRAWVSPDRRASVIIRAGHRAAQIGPLIANTDVRAIELLDAALASTSSRIFLDVPAHRTGLTRHLQRCGFRKQRPYRRMALGSSAILECPGHLYVLAGPEFG